MNLLLTARQLERLRELPPDHKLLTAGDGAPILERTDGRGDDLASLAHDRDLARRLEHNGVVSSRLQMHRTA